MYCFREFVMTMYQELKKLNPAFPILVRECSGIQARMTARYSESWICFLIVISR